MTQYLTEKQVIMLNFVMIKRYTPEEQVGVKDGLSQVFIGSFLTP